MKEEEKKKLIEFLEKEDYENFILFITNLEVNYSNYEALLKDIGTILHDKKFSQEIDPSSSKKELEDIINGVDKEDNYLYMHQKLKEAIIKIFKIKLKNVIYEDDHINDYLDKFEGDFNI